ncbi:MAG: hypothetical protein WD314_10260 [Trueperaceae bacterium]
MSTIVGMFDDQLQAQQAVNGLDALGLDEGSIHVLSRGELNRDSSLFAAFARAIRPGDGAVSSELMRLGLDREEAEFYEEELGDDSVVVVVKADGERGDMAMTVMQEANAAFKEP